MPPNIILALRTSGLALLYMLLLIALALFTVPSSNPLLKRVLHAISMVRDMQNQVNPVAFSGLPSTGNIVVKKGTDDKYLPAEKLDIQLIDPLTAGTATLTITASAARSLKLHEKQQPPFYRQDS